MKPWEQVTRILLVASHARHESALLDASSEEGVRCGSLRFEVVLWHLEQSADFFGGPKTYLIEHVLDVFFGPCTGHHPLRHGHEARRSLVSMPARWCRTTLGTLFNCSALHCTTGSVIILGFVFAQNTVLFL